MPARLAAVASSFRSVNAATRLRAIGVAAAAALLLSLAASLVPAHAASADTRYSLVNGCFSLQGAGGQKVGKSGGGYALGAGTPEAFRMQATDLGDYLLYGTGKDFLTAGSGSAVTAVKEPSGAAIWSVDEAGSGAFALTSRATGAGLGLGGQALAQGSATAFEFVAADGCASFPEIEVNASGKPSGGPTPYGETRGLIDAHLHVMFHQALGGSLHCGRPWDPLGVTKALPDCSESEGPGGQVAPIQNFVNWGSPVYPHDPVGWPTFKDWPNHHSLTYEQTYYKWMERAWMGGLRMMTLLAVDNVTLCKVANVKKYPCNEMQAVRREIKDAYKLQDYIDAQEGGPGKGWFRIVKNPFQARKVINKGKLAVILGVETSQLFDCGIYKDQPLCDAGDVEAGLDEVYAMGVRQMEIINKFDNAFGGVAGDSGAISLFTNAGNFLETGSFFALETCTGPAEDRPALIGIPHTDTALGLVPVLDPGNVPAYGPGPHCNLRGFTDLGERLLDGMIRRGMIFDPDHLSVKARSAALDYMAARGYSGIMSSHSWADILSYPRILEMGGVVTPMAGSSEGFVEEWRKLRKERTDEYYFGWGYGADMNGFASQGPPREGAPNPVKYPFKSSIDPGITIDRQRSGEKTFDINTDGVAHYGLYADWIEDLRMIAGDRIIEDMARGPEAYLQMWERSVGVAANRCRPKRAKLTGAGLAKLRLGSSAVAALKKAGQPERRVGRVYRYCVAGKRNRNAEVVGVFTKGRKLGLISSDATGHKAGGVRVGDRASRLRGAKRIGKRVYAVRAKGGARYAYFVKGGKVVTVAAASRSAKSSGEILRNLKLAR